VKQAAMIQLKNTIKSHWLIKDYQRPFIAPEQNYLISENDKAFLRQNIFLSMCKCTEKHIMYEFLTNFHIFFII
jgi:hypothetical protein